MYKQYALMPSLGNKRCSSHRYERAFPLSSVKRTKIKLLFITLRQVLEALLYTPK